MKMPILSQAARDRLGCLLAIAVTFALIWIMTACAPRSVRKIHKFKECPPHLFYKAKRQ
jgi:hypothetical protein